jgi:shikimate kinase
MYEIRKPMYEHFADFTVSNDTEPEETVAAILRQLEDRT